jgi:2-oxoisovalerate dehydrogenase E2 component (dihydrolipoyl transacylase)
MPQLGESIHEGTIERWLKQPGDAVNEFEPLLEVMTDKVSVEVPSTVTGTLTQILAHEGDVVASGSPICAIEEGAATTAPTEHAKAPTDGRPASSTPPASPPTVDRPERSSGDEHRFSPAVRAIAAEHNIDLNKVTGTGVGGRVTKQDVLAFVGSRIADSDRMRGSGAQAPSGREQAPLVAPASRPAPPPPQHPATPPSLGGDERVPLTTMRRLIADHMAHAKRDVPHAWQAAEVDMSRIVAFRNQVRDQFRKREGISLSYLPFVIQATSSGLRDNPAVNVSFDGDAIIRYKHVHIGVAVGLEEGLVVPVLRDADGLSLAGIARGVTDLAERARTKKLRPDDMQGGTFTVNNPGTFGSTLSYSIINVPQAGILTMEAVVDRVVVVEGMIAIRPIMFLCFSFDHRVIDGLQAARFLQGVRKRLEEFTADPSDV